MSKVNQNHYSPPNLYFFMVIASFRNESTLSAIRFESLLIEAKVCCTSWVETLLHAPFNWCCVSVRFSCASCYSSWRYWCWRTTPFCVFFFLTALSLCCEVEGAATGDNGLRSGWSVREGTPEEGFEGSGNGDGDDAVKMSTVLEGHQHFLQSILKCNSNIAFFTNRMNNLNAHICTRLF